MSESSGGFNQKQSFFSRCPEQVISFSCSSTNARRRNKTSRLSQHHSRNTGPLLTHEPCSQEQLRLLEDSLNRYHCSSRTHENGLVDSSQAQLLACLHSLSTQHVFASIPLQQMASIQNVADGLSIPAEKLARQIRFTAASGFLMEPQDGYVQHTALSAQFVTRPLLVDAVTFLGETVMDTAADTNNASRRQSQTSLSDDDSCQRRQRQFQAYQRLRRDSLDTAVSQVLLNFNWASLGDVKVVFVSCIQRKVDEKGKEPRY